MKPKYRKFVYLLSTFLESSKESKPADEPIDVIIPAIEKDITILPLCLEGVKRFVTNKIKTIYLVAPDNEIMRNFSREYNLVFVDENSVLGYGTEAIHYVLMDGRNRSGWIFQQLLKLSGNVGTCSHFLVIDADHILIRPHTFLTVEGKTVFYRSRECHFPYYEAIDKLLGERKRSLLSYVSHKMLFSREVLENLKKAINQYTGKTWTEAIMTILDVRQQSCFSEYEIYGNFFPTRKAENKLFRNKTLTYKEVATLDDLVVRYSRRYRSVTFPDYRKISY